MQYFRDGIPLVPGAPIDDLPEPVLHALYGDADTVYAVLDAACLPGLVALMDADGLTYASLFSGALADEAVDAAPYIVAVARDCRLLRCLMTSNGTAQPAPGAFWSAQAGLFFRTQMTLTDLRTHLRRFMRVLDSKDRPYFLRFWQPRYAEQYFVGLQDRPAKIARWFFPKDSAAPIERLCIPVRTATGTDHLVCVSPVPNLVAVEPEQGSFRLDRRDVEVFRLVKWDQDVATVAAQLQTTFADQMAELDPDQRIAFCDTVMRRLMPLGFVQLDMLFIFCAWELNYGPEFETRDGLETVAALLHADLPAEVRFERIKQVVENWEMQSA